MSYKIIKILFLKGVKAQRYNNALDKNLGGCKKASTYIWIKQAGKK